jgi:hypothetical protein
MTPTQPPSPGPKKPLVVATGMSRRDFAVAAAIVVGLLGFVFAAIYSTGTAKNPNMLQGIVREKYKSGEQVRDIVVSAEKGIAAFPIKSLTAGTISKFTSLAWTKLTM